MSARRTYPLEPEVDVEDEFIDVLERLAARCVREEDRKRLRLVGVVLAVSHMRRARSSERFDI